MRSKWIFAFALISYAGLVGCRRKASDCIAYDQPWDRDVQYVTVSGNDCALVQCASADSLCLVTIDIDILGPQKHILGRANSIAFAERYCHPIKRIVLH